MHLALQFHCMKEFIADLTSCATDNRFEVVCDLVLQGIIEIKLGTTNLIVRDLGVAFVDKSKKLKGLCLMRHP